MRSDDGHRMLRRCGEWHDLTDQSITGDVTSLLHACRAGDDGAREALYRLVYDELKAIALRHLGQHRRLALDPTELVNEAVLRLLEDRVDAQNRAHFFRIAATAIRCTLVDLIRQRQAEKRGGGVVITWFDIERESAPSGLSPEQRWLEIEDALTVLDKLYPRPCRVLELAFLIGLSQQQIAEALSINLRTVERDLRFAKTWLRGQLSE
ncbi:ECF-type sigma factor [Lysobacter capsici]|uniref:ECF-type sigma factor n=1 Tax=Lysobacter capsici TaxID=435897 RepID=UPI001C005EAD|nr:ECF-type sigma factor [Lysobacter capsici]QWF16935.1 sigma-70 family RNA polymerase sigma factor [Lysobacter capsici]